MSLKDRRKALQDDLLYRTVVSLDEFIGTFVPKLPEGVEVTSNFVTQMDEAQIWNGFLPPSNAEGNEDAIFKRLTPIFDKMVQLAQTQWENSCPKHQWSLLTALTSAPTTPERPSSFKPDACFYRNSFSRTMSHSYYDMAFTAEFKKHNRSNDVADNITKVIYAMQHLMGGDARRRFIFGITIENTSLRLWYANRSMLVSSTPLDIVEGKIRFIQIFLSFAFASDVDMGWDPSVELLQHAEGNFYHIMVGDTRYRTLKVLQDLGANYLRSRAARTFKVKKVGGNDDNTYVLKDLWLEQDRKPEHQIYEEIISDVRRLYPQRVDIVRRHLFTPVDHTFVEANGVRDDTKASMMRNKSLVSEIVRLPVITVSSTRHVHAPEETCHRVHYRIVFKEYATPLHKVKKMGEVFAVLADLMGLFRLFHGSGWVHRDISVGNVYLHEGRGVLGDLEFAKNTAGQSQHELRTGTIDFMPVETIALKFLFHLSDTRPSLADTKKKLTFRYHALHDIESAWWLGVWVMYLFRPKGHEESSKTSKLRQDQTNAIFPGTLTHEIRTQLLEHQNEFYRTTGAWIAEESGCALEVLDDVRILLLKLYQDLEKSFPDSLPMLSSPANPASGAAFPGGPTCDIYQPIKDLFLKAKDVHKDTELVSFKVVANESPQM